MNLAGTGHRPSKLGGYDNATYTRLVALAQTAIKELKPELVISGGALGWDMALAAAANIERVPFLVAVPFKGQEAMWPKLTQERYQRMLERAQDVVIVCEGGYEARKMQVRNEWMVDHCDLLLALWNGSNGGTANCIEYAERVGRPIKNLWATWEST
jgi:uncharacterized phage-like protein YoqJ